MGMLSRYQKAGGFVQLLALIETCGKAKQENFLNMIEKEDPRWAVAIKQKMLSIEKILSWSDNQVSEIFSRVNEITLATALHGLTATDAERILKTFSHSQKRKIEDLRASSKGGPAEVSTAYVKIIEEVRHMIKDRYILLEKFAPDMVIEPEIEDKIGKSMSAASMTSESSPSPVTSHTLSEPSVPDMDAFGAAPAASGGDQGGNHAAEVKDLRVKVQSLHHENTQLKNELKMLKEKVAQIKKLAA